MSADREDFLTEDPEIPSQRWSLLSFLSPEKVLARKDVFFFSSFVKQYEFQVRSQSLEKYLMNTVKDINDKLEKEANEFDAKDLSGVATLCRNAQIRIDGVMHEFQEFIKKNTRELTATHISDEFDEYMFKNKVNLEDEFYAKNDFHTSMRGLKIRGVYSDKGEAEMRAKRLQKSDPIHNIYVAEVGKWLPWDPSPHEIKDQEYAEEQLNTLMKKYKENEEARQDFHEKQRAAGRKQKKVFTDANETTEPAVTLEQVTGTAADTEVPSLGSGSSQFAGMFSSAGPADLAIQRKIEKKMDKQ